MKRLVALLLVVAAVIALAAPVATGEWWEDLDGCRRAELAGWHHPGYNAWCVVQVLWELVTQPGWEWE